MAPAAFSLTHLCCIPHTSTHGHIPGAQMQGNQTMKKSWKYGKGTLVYRAVSYTANTSALPLLLHLAERHLSLVKNMALCVPLLPQRALNLSRVDAGSLTPFLSFLSASPFCSRMSDLFLPKAALRHFTACQQPSTFPGTTIPQESLKLDSSQVTASKEITPFQGTKKKKEKQNPKTNKKPPSKH